MSARALIVAKLIAGGLLCLLVLYAIAFAGHVLEQLYPCRVTDPETGAERAVSCLYQQPPGEAP